MRRSAALGHPERNQRGRRQQPGQERLLLRIRRREYADHPGRRERLHRKQDSLRSRQGCQRRRRRHLGPRNVAERAAAELEP